METAFIFPAFVTEYLGNELDILKEFSAEFPKYLSRISEITNEDYESFFPGNPDFIENELRSQIISYTFGCCLADALMAGKLQPDLLSGYSMGLYAALYAGRVYHFESGIRLIEKAFRFARQAVQKVPSGMGSVIGLTVEEIGEIIRENDLKVEIANVNSRHAHLISGQLEDLKQLLMIAETEGALRVTRLLVETPYHSQLLQNTKDEFSRYISGNISLKDSAHPLVSAIDQRLFSSAGEIAEELVNNLFRPLNWQAAFEKMLETGVQRFVECGAGKSLYNISRFVPGNFKVYPMHKLERILIR